MTLPSIVALAVGLRLGAGLDVEVAAGQLPSRGTGRSETSATATAVPSLQLEEVANRDRIALRYFPRFFWRYPDSLELGRPTLLHQLSSSWTRQLSPRSSAGLDVTGAYGEADFTATQAVFGDTQFTSPEQTVANVGRINGSANFSTRLAPRWTLELRLPAGYQRTERPLFPDASRSLGSVGVNPVLNHALTRSDALSLDVSGTVFRSELSQFLQTQASLGWGHRYAPQWSTQLTGGAARVDVIDSPEPAAPTYFAIGSGSVTHQRRYGSEAVSIGVDARVDPIFAQVRPRATASLGADQQLAPDLTLSADVFGSTVVAEDPLPNDPNESVAGGSLSMAWRIDPMFRLRWGARASWAGPHWSEGFESRQRTVLGFVGLSIAFPGEEGR